MTLNALPPAPRAPTWTHHNTKTPSHKNEFKLDNASTIPNQMHFCNLFFLLPTPNHTYIPKPQILQWILHEEAIKSYWFVHAMPSIFCTTFELGSQVVDTYKNPPPILRSYKYPILKWTPHGQTLQGCQPHVWSVINSPHDNVEMPHVSTPTCPLEPC